MTEKNRIFPENAGSGTDEAARAAVLAQILALVPFDGFSSMTLRQAAKAADLGADSLILLFPRGVADLLRYWSRCGDEALYQVAQSEDLAAMRVRDRIKTVLLRRLAYLDDHHEAARRAAAYLALPMHGALAAELAWTSVDAMWRAIGDVSTDGNFYSKRATLLAVWADVLSFYLAEADREDGEIEARIDQRIDNVMQIEKAKGRLRDVTAGAEKLLHGLARARFGSRPF